MNIRRALLLSDALYLISGALLGPFYAIFVREIGGDLIEAGGAFALFMLTAGVVVFLLARWEDKSRHPKKFIIAGYAIGAIGTAGYLFVNSSLSLFIVQIILGLSVALKDPAYDALFSKSGKRHLALAWGEWEAMDYFALGIGAFSGAFIAQNLGFQTLFKVMLVMSIFSLLFSSFLIKTKK